MAGKLVEELRNLASLLERASASVNVIADEIQGIGLLSGDLPAPDDALDAVPWGALVERAQALLQEDPARLWKPGELVRAARSAGVELASLQGVHFGLVPRLRERGLIDETDGGFRAASFEVSPKVRRELPWGEIVPAAMQLLRAEPARRWGPAELVRAVRDGGVALDNLQGIHFGLVSRLGGLGVVSLDDEGKVRLHDAPAPESELVASVDDVPKARRELPWGEIVPGAMRLLRADPSRAWGPAELVRAVRDGGVALVNLQGIHFGLVSRLEGLGVVRLDDEGKLRLNDVTAPDLAPDVELAEQQLTEEVDACEMFLARHSLSQRTAQVAVWAGRARELQEAWRSDGSVGELRHAALRRVFGRLTRIAREQRCEWIDALSPEWSMSWPLYEAWQSALVAGELPTLSPDDKSMVFKGLLRGLLVPSRKNVSGDDVVALLTDALEVLPPDDVDVRAVEARFGRLRRAVAPVLRKAPSAPAPAPSPQTAVHRPAIAATVLAVTRGKKAVIVGGTGAREPHRQALQEAFAFGELDWAWLERGATGQFARTEERISHGSYDVVLFLAGYTSHKSVPLLRACKASGVPLVYLPRGYSVAQVAYSIEEQLVAKGG